MLLLSCSKYNIKCTLCVARVWFVGSIHRIAELWKWDVNRNYYWIATGFVNEIIIIDALIAQHSKFTSAMPTMRTRACERSENKRASYRQIWQQITTTIWNPSAYVYACLLPLFRIIIVNTCQRIYLNCVVGIFSTDLCLLTVWLRRDFWVLCVYRQCIDRSGKWLSM